MRTILLFIGAMTLNAQTQTIPDICIANNNCYVAYKETSLSSAAEKITVQAGTLNVKPFSATIYCSDAAVITLSQNGTAASTTSLTPTRINGAPVAKATAYYSSNVGSGTQLGAPIRIPTGGGTFIWDLSHVIAYGNSAGAQNFSIGTSSVTATCSISILFQEGNT